MNAEIIVFIGYFVILLGVALVFYFNGSNKNEKDYFLGGRSMGPWVTAMSAQASDMSAWLLMGLPGSILDRYGSVSDWRWELLQTGYSVPRDSESSAKHPTIPLRFLSILPIDSPHQARCFR